MANNRIKHWTVRRSRRRSAGFWEIVNTRGVVFVCYGNESDARLAALAPRLCHYTKQQADRGDAVAAALVAELNGSN